MKHLLLTTIAAVLLVGCGRPPKDIWGAAEQGDIEAVKEYLAIGTNVNAMGEDGETPLHFAAIGGQKEIAELLIAKGADVNARDSIGGTPLHKAALRGRKEIAELLIANGADVNAKDILGKTPLDWANMGYKGEPPEDKAVKKEIADLLRKHGGKTGEELKAEEK